MKIITLLGTRPEIIRLSLIIKKLDFLCEHILVHTGQNYDEALFEVFFRNLELRQPDYIFETKSNTAFEQISKILVETEKIFLKEKPDKLLILGDTNSALAAFVAKRMGIPVFHMEAGNRCYDDRVPEEVNRKIIDHSSNVHMPYTERSRYNLLKEGIQSDKIFVIGNPIFEVLNFYNKKIEESLILDELNITKNNYFLVTLHREENVDEPERLMKFINALEIMREIYNKKIVISLHPRTKNKIDNLHINMDANAFIISKPFGFFDFINLEKNAFCVLSDSGTVQEECSILKIPNVTLRDVTERPETIECGSNIISGAEHESILQAVKLALENDKSWTPPIEYTANNVANRVLNILFSYVR